MFYLPMHRRVGQAQDRTWRTLRVSPWWHQVLLVSLVRHICGRLHTKAMHASPTASNVTGLRHHSTFRTSMHGRHKTCDLVDTSTKCTCQRCVEGTGQELSIFLFAPLLAPRPKWAVPDSSCCKRFWVEASVTALQTRLPDRLAVGPTSIALAAPTCPSDPVRHPASGQVPRQPPLGSRPLFFSFVGS